MTTQPVCVIGKSRKINCIDVHEGQVGRFIAALKPDMNSFTDLINGINAMLYPWNFDYYEPKWNEQKRKYEIAYFNYTPSPRTFGKYLNEDDDISFEELKQRPLQYDQHFPSNTLIIDLPSKQVVNLTVSGGGYRFIPARTSVWKWNDPKAEKKVKKCKEDQKTGKISKDFQCNTHLEEETFIPEGFQASTVLLRKDQFYNEVDAPRVAEFADEMLKCNPNGTVLKNTAKCISKISDTYKKVDIKAFMKSDAKLDKDKPQDVITIWK